MSSQDVSALVSVRLLFMYVFSRLEMLYYNIILLTISPYGGRIVWSTFSGNLSDENISVEEQ